MQVVRALLDARAPGAKVADSILETKLGRILSSLRPVWSCVVIIDGRAYVLDCAFLDVLLAVEADGWASHCGACSGRTTSPGRARWSEPAGRCCAIRGA
jgi:hypothetical protein